MITIMIVMIRTPPWEALRGTRREKAWKVLESILTLGNITITISNTRNIISDDSSPTTTTIITIIITTIAIITIITITINITLIIIIITLTIIIMTTQGWSRISRASSSTAASAYLT